VVDFKRLTLKHLKHIASAVQGAHKNRNLGRIKKPPAIPGAFV
jgi:hypothetical protein